MKTAIAVLFILFAPFVALPQMTKKIPVAVSHDESDQVGQSVYFALKEAIRASQSFRFVDHEEAPTTPRLVVYLVSMDENLSGTKGTSSAIAITIVYDSEPIPVRGAYISSGIMTCGRGKIDWCVKNTLVSVDQAVEALRKSWPQLWKNL